MLIFGQNAFSEKLGPRGFNMFLMLVVDLMHEFELGVWKALFIHLLRILNAENSNLVHTLDQRYVAESILYFKCSCSSKFSPSANLWQRHNPTIFK